MRLLTLGVVATVMMASAAQAAAPAPHSASNGDSDARCLLAMVALSNSKDQRSSAIGQGGVAYFAGQVVAHNPGYDFARLKALAAGMNPTTAEAEVQRCAPMFVGTMQKLQSALGGPPKSSPAPNPTPTPKQ